MKTIHFIMFLLISMLSLSSCSKDDNAPVITITAPAEGAILEKGKTYAVQGTVTDDVELAEIDAGGVKITTFDSKTKHTLANLNLPIPANATAGNSTFTVTATDKEGNVGTKTVTFKIQ
ncbi:MAG: Ig-like domain-containing protein [Saprospiraceae bacterium]